MKKTNIFFSLLLYEVIEKMAFFSVAYKNCTSIPLESFFFSIVIDWEVENPTWYCSEKNYR